MRDKALGGHLRDAPDMAGAIIERWRRGGMSETELEDLTSAASHVWWAWDALNVISPECATFPRPKRSRGRDASVHAVRDIRIHFEVKRLHAAGMPLKKAYKIVAEELPMRTWKSIEAIYRKEHNREGT